MSRVAKAPVNQPTNVETNLVEGIFTVKGPKGVLTHRVHKLVNIEMIKESNQLKFIPVEDVPKAWAQAGTTRALVNNMIKGVTDGFTVTLELVGVGYRAQAKDNTISLSLGYSHPIVYTLPKGVSAETPAVTSIVLKGSDKQALGQVASEIRAFRPPEPYKGKGVKYLGEQIARKEAKKK